MTNNPMLLRQLVTAIQQDRLAQAEAWRLRERARNNGVGQPAPRAETIRSNRDLATWISRISDEVSGQTPEFLDGDIREAFTRLLSELVAAGRRGGVSGLSEPEQSDPPVVLLRILSTLASRTSGQSIGVSRSHRRVLESAFENFVGGGTSHKGTRKPGVAA